MSSIINHWECCCAVLSLKLNVRQLWASNLLSDSTRWDTRFFVLKYLRSRSSNQTIKLNQSLMRLRCARINILPLSLVPMIYPANYYWGWFSAPTVRPFLEITFLLFSIVRVLDVTFIVMNSSSVKFVSLYMELAVECTSNRQVKNREVFF